jgi:hypothetical protein
VDLSIPAASKRDTHADANFDKPQITSGINVLDQLGAQNMGVVTLSSERRSNKIRQPVRCEVSHPR